MKKGDFVDRTGEKHTTKEGYEIKIIKCLGVLNCTVQFEDGTILKNKRYDHIIRGTIRNPFHKSVSDVGYLGIGKYSRKTNYKIYSTWSAMLKRCYDKKRQENQPTYISCSVDDRWHNFQIFAEWFEENYIEGLALDKDILIKGNKIYSPETCCFVPQEINNLFPKADIIRGKYPIGVHKVNYKFQATISITGKKVHLGFFDTIEEAFQAYKTAKEIEIKSVADEWMSRIDSNIYKAMYNYKVEIDD